MYSNDRLPTQRLKYSILERELDDRPADSSSMTSVRASLSSSESLITARLHVPHFIFILPSHTVSHTSILLQATAMFLGISQMSS